jgi:hypothetical protein
MRTKRCTGRSLTIRAALAFLLFSGTASAVDLVAYDDAIATYLDDISLVERATPPPPPAVVNVTVDPNGSRHAINPLIYGVAHFDDPGSSQLSYPARRWGGNATTRYNWQIDIQNRASDYFFLNIPNDVANPSQLPSGSTADLWIDGVKAHQGEPVLTVPTIGWAPKGSNPNTDRIRTFGYSIPKYGAQETNECQVNNYPGCQADAGNGCTPASTPGNCTWLAVTPDPTDTSMAVTPAYFTQWMDHIASRVGTAANGGVKYLVLDNEPMLWNFSHHDVHPDPVTYDELWQKSRDSAAAFKAKDPAARVLGGAAWGWCEYFNSSKDSAPPAGACGPQPLGAGTDYATHGNMFWLPYLLQRAEAYRVASGVRILDFLDVHYYPQSGKVTLSVDESAGTAALRLRSLKSLYDPAYVDESWIGQPVALIPRMKTWIAQYAPGTKLAVNEYNWGDGTTSSALAQAEALAIFGREGVDMANRWTVPRANSLLEDAFLLYLNYDGAGSKVAGDSVGAASSDVDAVGAYTVRGPGSLYFLLFNKDTIDRQASVSVAGGGVGTASLYRFSGAMRLGSAGTANATGGNLALTLPARSATLVVLPYAAIASPLNFYTLPPCRLVDTRGAAGPLGAPALSAGVPRVFTLTGSCGVPATAKALSLNVTVVNPSAPGDLRLYPGDQGVPNASTITCAAGKTRANNSLMGLSADGTGSIAVQPNLAFGTVHLILDVNGYFQ